ILDLIQRNEEFLSAKNDKEFIGGRVSSAIPKSYQTNQVSQGLLYGSNKIDIDPIYFLNKQEGVLKGFYHVGSDLNNKNSRLHNGIVSIMLDEGLCYCGFNRLPSKRGVTAKLSIDFVNEIKTDATLVLRAKIVSSKGRKVVIDGHVETLPLNEYEAPIRVANANCILVEPRWFKYFRWVKVF
ncbi:Mrx3p ASCRUDRAFT_26300, partial [Ascoidea rubescens DSM 1968]